MACDEISIDDLTRLRRRERTLALAVFEDAVKVSAEKPCIGCGKRRAGSAISFRFTRAQCERLKIEYGPMCVVSVCRDCDRRSDASREFAAAVEASIFDAIEGGHSDMIGVVKTS